MSKTIEYTIEFFTDWHCGSGLSSGADLDLLVIKDEDHLPFIPGKTIKGLVREAVEEINEFRLSKKTGQEIEQAFGNKEGKLQGCCFFKNAELPENLKTTITNHQLQKHLYRSLASTAIGDNGNAKEHSLRKLEVTVPCQLEGEILDVPDDFAGDLENGLKYIKRLGQNRNRGLGRCKIEVIPSIEEGDKQ